MRWGRPKSLSGLMLVGLALIAVPLLVALLTAVLQIRNLADTGTKIVIQGVAGARASQALFGQIASLERMARLYDVLGDPKLLDLYRTQDERLSTTREQLQLQATSDARHTQGVRGVATKHPLHGHDHAPRRQRRDGLEPVQPFHAAVRRGRARGTAEPRPGRHGGGRPGRANPAGAQAPAVAGGTASSARRHRGVRVHTRR